MYQVIELSDKEQLKLYMKQPKKKLAEMILQCNKLLKSRSEKLEFGDRLNLEDYPELVGKNVLVKNQPTKYNGIYKITESIIGKWK